MLTKTESKKRGILTAFGVLVVGILIGAIARPLEWLWASQGPPQRLYEEGWIQDGPFTGQGDKEAPENGLETIRIEIGVDGVGRILASRVESMERGLMTENDDSRTAATITHDGRDYGATVRLKGDYTDHIATEQWSLRVFIEDGKLLGMRAFSMQAPYTRGYLWEWLVLEAMRREGVLAPRSMFLNVLINGRYNGIYFVEEHFSKEMLEAQGRREGPILAFEESARWSTQLVNHNVKGFATHTSRALNPTFGPERTEVKAFGERKLSSSELLSRGLQSGLENMLDLQRLAIVASKNVDQLKRLEALAELEGQSVDTIMDVELLARAHALAGLFRLQHSLHWHNRRYYQNPVTDRLEPIMFDNLPHEPGGTDPVMLSPRGTVAEFMVSTSYYNRSFEHLGRYASAEYLDELLEEVGEELRSYETALLEQMELGGSYRVDAMTQRLRRQQVYLKKFLNAKHLANFSGVAGREEDGISSGTLEVRAWSLTRVPTVLEGFRFSNGGFIRAADVFASDLPEAAVRSDGGVVLPRSGRAVLFRFASDRRLSALQGIEQIKEAIVEEIEGGAPTDLDVYAVFRGIAATEKHEQRLWFRRFDDSWQAEGGRPSLPSLAEALDRHSFLGYDFDRDRLFVRPGKWDVEGDLVVPRDYPLYAGARVRLRFAEDAILLSETPLIFRGSEKNPVTLEPAEGVASWSGIVVLNTKEPSDWRNVVVRKTHELRRAGWMTTGGITFYNSPAKLADCTIEGTLAEDGLNVFGTSVDMQRVTFRGCVSDSFDGDFVTGRLMDCVFEDGHADGVDFSGSDVTVQGCTFQRMGDKGISVGENSRVEIIGCEMNDVSIGVAAKDLSEVRIRDTRITGARTYAIALYVKKPEFGPSSVVAQGLEIAGSGIQDVLVQTGCSLEIGGVAAATEDFDVQKLYRDEVLGN